MRPQTATAKALGTARIGPAHTERDGREESAEPWHPRGRLPLGPLGPLVALVIAAVAATGCTPRARMLPAAERVAIDRSVVEYPSGFTLHRYIENLTGATA